MAEIRKIMDEVEKAELLYHSLERCAWGFALEDANWERFIEWLRETAVGDDIRRAISEGINRDFMRAMWMAHSPDPAVRAMAEPFDAV